MIMKRLLGKASEVGIWECSPRDTSVNLESFLNKKKNEELGIIHIHPLLSTTNKFTVQKSRYAQKTFSEF